MADALKTYLLLTEKKWHDQLFEELKNEVPGQWIRYSSKEDFTLENIRKIKPDLIFIPHWSHIIPAPIFEPYECIVFHMTDLPYGRGGSPLQNLIVRGHRDTMISAIRVTKGIDTGPVYLKTPLTLNGTAQEIFNRSAKVIKEMIKEIITRQPIPAEQEGEPVIFKRRSAEESNIAGLQNIAQVYDYIRMLDAEGYPKAFLETENFRFEFSNATEDSGNTLKADVRIIKK